MDYYRMMTHRECIFRSVCVNVRVHLQGTHRSNSSSNDILGQRFGKVLYRHMKKPKSEEQGKVTYT